MNIKSFSMTARGSSHIKVDKICQDASGHYSSENIHIAVVCDGHGGDDYIRSDVGSKICVQVALDNLKAFAENIGFDRMRVKKDRDALLNQLKVSIIGQWNKNIEDHYASNPFTEQESRLLSEHARRKYIYEDRFQSAYGTTMIAVLVTDKYWIGLHIGDGKCVAVSPEGKFMQPIPWDEKCFLNVTTSICDEDALDNLRDFCSPKLPIAVFIGSDGIDDCFKNDEQLYDFYRTMLYSFASSEFEKASAELEDFLPRLSKKGSGDDVSISAILDFDKIGDLDIVKKYDRAKEKAKVDAIARAEAESKREAVEYRDKLKRENELKNQTEFYKAEAERRKAFERAEAERREAFERAEAERREAFERAEAERSEMAKRQSLEEAETVSIAEEVAPIVEDNLSTEGSTPIVEDNLSTEEPAPIVEDNLSTEEVAPIVEDNLSTEEVAPIVEDNLSAEKPAPIVEDNLSTEGSAPIVEDNLSTEEPAPIVEDNLSAEEPAPIVEDNLIAEGSALSVEDNLSTEAVSDEAFGEDWDDDFCLKSEVVETVDVEKQGILLNSEALNSKSLPWENKPLPWETSENSGVVSGLTIDNEKYFSIDSVEADSVVLPQRTQGKD